MLWPLANDDLPRCAALRPDRCTARARPADNLSSHKRPAIRSAGARLLFLPPYSPDLNLSEQVFAKLKHLMREAAERSHEATWRRVGTHRAELVKTLEADDGRIELGAVTGPDYGRIWITSWSSR